MEFLLVGERPATSTKRHFWSVVGGEVTGGRSLLLFLLKVSPASLAEWAKGSLYTSDIDKETMVLIPSEFVE